MTEFLRCKTYIQLQSNYVVNQLMLLYRQKGRQKNMFTFSDTCLANQVKRPEIFSDIKLTSS